MTKRWKRRPDGSTWGDWGEDDELGRINLLTPEKVLQGVREVEAGVSFCLSLPLDYPGGTALNQRRYPPVLAPTDQDAAPPLSHEPTNKRDTDSARSAGDDRYRHTRTNRETTAPRPLAVTTIAEAYGGAFERAIAAI